MASQNLSFQKEIVSEKVQVSITKKLNSKTEIKGNKQSIIQEDH